MMKHPAIKWIQKVLANEVVSYLIFGLATTIVSVSTRLLFYLLTKEEMLATLLGDCLGIIFAFLTNDTFVFKQVRAGRLKRFGQFFVARLGTLGLNLILTFLFVSTYPQILGVFVDNDLDKVNALETFLAQIVIMVLNYLFSKWFVFKTPKSLK